jgi:hypothetical protein
MIKQTSRSNKKNVKDIDVCVKKFKKIYNDLQKENICT